MCPHGYHHNGFMATPALGTQVYINERKITMFLSPNMHPPVIAELFRIKMNIEQ